MQSALTEEGVDGWLFYDFQGSDSIARRILSIAPNAHLTRRWFYWVPKVGTPKKLVHKIEPHALDHLPGECIFYAGWKELEKNLGVLLKGEKQVSMNYSPNNAIPYVSRVDGGTLEFVQKTGVNVVSAADLIQKFEAVWSEDQLQSHVRAAKALRTTVDEAFEHVAKTVSSNQQINEYELQTFIREKFEAHGLRKDDYPIVAVNSNSGNPHYTPTKESFEMIQKDCFLLMDIWSRERSDNAVYADITWTGYVGKEVPEKHESIFQIVRGGRDAAVQFVEEAYQTGKSIQGWQVDDAARSFITQKGYGDAFIHRTGHNIGCAVHGNGANMDNFETREERKIIPQTCFSVEPGIYLKEFGVRSEIDVYVDEKGVHIYGQPLQSAVVPILK